MHHIFIAGAGYTGMAVARHFRSKNQKVWALTRSADKAAQLESLGVAPVVRDLCGASSEAPLKIPPAHFVVISLAPDERSEESYRKTYVEAVGRLLAAMKANPRPFLVVYLSSIGVYGDRAGAWVEESTPPEPDSERGRILLEAENQVLESGFPALIFRLGGIYGPSRNPLARLRKKEGESQARDAWLNLIHLEDIVGAMEVLFNKGKEGGIYLGVDDEPVKRSEITGWLARQPDFMDRVLPPGFKTDSTSGKRCSNKNLKALGYSFRFPNFREGYQALIHSAEL